MITFFPDQQKMFDELRQSMQRNKSVLLQSATGSGKTVIGSQMVINVIAKQRKASFFVPRRDLLDQTSNTFNKYNCHHSYIAAGRDYNPFGSIYVGMIDTAARRLKKWADSGKQSGCPLPNVDVAVFDETHFGEGALDSVIRHYQAIGAWTIGLSATPWKLNGQGLGIWYNDMVQGPSIRYLIDNKRLSDYRYFYGRTREDFHAMQRKTDKEIASIMETKRAIIGDAVNDYKLRALGKLHIVRCTSITHSQITAESFRQSGVNAIHVDGNTPDEEKQRIFTAFAKRQISVLTFADLLNFGFDLSQATGIDTCIESCSDLKPSKSLAGQMQFWGRVLRAKPFPAIINDHVNNWKEHGVPCSAREWTLESLTRKAGGERVPPTRQCPSCFFVHSPAPACPECGSVYEVLGRMVKEKDGDLVEINKEEVEKQRLRKQHDLHNCKTLSDLQAYAKKYGYKSGWAFKYWQVRQDKGKQNA